MRKPTGEQLRDEGIDAVINSNKVWAEQAKALFERWTKTKRSGTEFIAEEFRQYARESGLPAPGHPNAWGGIFSHIARSELVEDTGSTRKMRDPDSHARRSPVYRIV